MRLKVDPDKPCERCGMPLTRQRFGDRLDVMLREQRYAAERQAELGRLLSSATTREQADALVRQLLARLPEQACTSGQVLQPVLGGEGNVVRFQQAMNQGRFAGAVTSACKRESALESFEGADIAAKRI